MQSTAIRLQPAIAFIVVSAFLDVMAMGLVIPVLPSLVESLVGSTAAAGFWTGLLVALWGAMQFAFSPLVGAVSDSYGRRPVLLISAAGLAADWVLIALAPNLGWLVVGRMLGGITSSSFTAIYAYMADITAPEDRSKAFGLVGAAWAAGFVIGPALGGTLAAWGPRMPFWVAAALAGVSFLYGCFVLPESLPKDRRMAFAWGRANPLGALRLLRSHVELADLSLVNFLLYFGYHVFSAVYVLYAQHRFGFSMMQVGLLMAAMGVLDLLMQSWVIGKVVGKLGDRSTLVVGLVAGAIGFVAIAAAPSPWLFAAALIPNAMWALAIPTLQSLMSARVSEREQGQLQGAITSMGSVAGIASPLFFGWLYGVTSDTFPYAGFLVASAVFALAAVIAQRSSRNAAQA